MTVSHQVVDGTTAGGPTRGAGPGRGRGPVGQQREPADATADRATAMDRLATGVAIIDADGAVVWANDAFGSLHGRASGLELVGLSVVALHADGDNPYDHPDALRVVQHPPTRYEFERERSGVRLLYRLGLLAPAPASSGAGPVPNGRARPEHEDANGHGHIDHRSAPRLDGDADRLENDRENHRENQREHQREDRREATSAGPRFVLEVVALPDRPAVGTGPVAEAALDDLGRIVAANASFGRLVGESPDRLQGRQVGELVHPRDLAGLDRALDDARRAGRRDAPPVEIRLARGDGRPAWAEIQVIRTGGQVERVLVARDVTDRKRDELLLHEVFDASPVPYALVALDGTIASINPAWREQFGCLDDLPARLVDLLDPDGADELAERLSPAAGADRTTAQDRHRAPRSSDGGFELHAVATGRDGAPVAVRLRATALHDLSGRLERWLVSVDDLTEHALEVEIARRNAQRVRGTLDQLDLAVVVHDAEARVRDVNLGAHRLFGAGATDLVGERSLPRWWHPCRPDGRPLADEEHPASIVLAGGSATAETTIGLQLGTSRRRWFAVRARATTDDAHRRTGAVVSYAEVTEIEGRRRASEEEEGLLLDAFEALPVAVYQASRDFLTTRTSSVWRQLVQSATGSAEPLPTDLFAVIHRDDRRAAVASFDEVAATGSTVRFHHRLVGGDPDPRWVDHHVAALVDRSGEVTAFVGTVVPVPEWVAQGDRTRRLVRLVETTNDLVGEFDLSTRHVTYLNPRAIEMFEADSHRLDRLSLERLYAPEAQAIFEREIWPALRQRGRWEGELPMIDAAGRTAQVQQWITAEHDADGRIVRLVAAGHDVTDRSQREAELALRATHDPLTGLPNRALLLEHIEDALSTARHTDRLVALVFLDIDRFKQVNDRNGHDAGDALLVAVATRLRSVVRPGDLVARLGGDEFVVLCPSVGNADEALALANRISLAVGSAPYPSSTAGGRFEGRMEHTPDHRPGHDADYGDDRDADYGERGARRHAGEQVADADFGRAEGMRVTASLGVAVSSGGDHPEALLRDADAAMYRAKELGRSRIELFDETMRRQASSRVQLVEELRASLGTGAITVHYQPCIDLHTGEVRAVEALARWEHPTRGLLEPSEFIDVAEASGLLDDLGGEVLRQATTRARSWERRFGSAAPAVNVNLSSRQMTDHRLPGLVRKALTDSGLRPDQLCLELTESALLEHDAHSSGTIAALKALGVRLAIDDFGTGYSSLSYLSQLPVDVVKIDRSFVAGLDPDREQDAVVAAAIITLARALGLGTIAEGVTTVAQLAELHRLGCDAAQGFYFSTPLTGDDIDRYLASRVALTVGSET